MKNTKQNPYSVPEQNSSALLKRFYIYQKERFPFLAHGILIASFTFSAIAYSRICRGETTFIDWLPFCVAVFSTLTLFFLVRVFDEFKDADDDAQFRQELPVPRGLISLIELKTIGISVFVLQLSANALFFPKMLPLLFAVLGYLILMGKEFFIKTWLKEHQLWYVVSHMLIIPLIDVFASGFDWHLSNEKAPFGLIFFFFVSFTNGIVLEVGRKIKAPVDEAKGVVTYSQLLGAKKAVYLWVVMLCTTLCLSIGAGYFAGFAPTIALVLSAFFLLCCFIAYRFLSAPTKSRAKSIELFSALWTIVMYLSLGGIPMLIHILS